MANEKSLKVFYDGGCRVCDSEISVYRKVGREAAIEFVDIAAPEFDPNRYGKDRGDFMQALHVLDEAGQFHVGVQAFRILWKRLPGSHYHLLAGLAGLPGLNKLAEFGYGFFARNRHHLPRKPDKR